jgi:hypothetical protein
LGSQQAKAGPEGRARRKSQAKRRSQRTLPLMPPGCHGKGYAEGLRLREVTREASYGTPST